MKMKELPLEARRIDKLATGQILCKLRQTTNAITLNRQKRRSFNSFFTNETKSAAPQTRRPIRKALF
jgi:hypothetical protein